MHAKIVLMTAAILLSGQVYAQSATTTAPKATTTKKKKSAAAATTQTPATTTAPVVETKAVEAKPVEAVKPAEPTLTTAQEVLKYMKEKFSASYHGEYYFVRRDAMSANEADKDLQDLKIMHNPTIIYKPTKNWQVMATSEFKYADLDGDTSFPNKWFRALFTLTRKNILTEKENGVQLDAGIGRRQFNAGVTALSSYGNDRAFATVSKTFGKHNASLFTQYLFNDYKQHKATTWKHGIELIPTLNLQLTEKLSWLINDDMVFNIPKDDNTARDFSMSHEVNIGYINYQWNDKVGTYYQLKYYHSNDFTKNFQTEDDYFEHYIGVAYAFTPKATLTAEVGSEIFHARDGKDGFSEKIKYPEFALYLDVSL